MVEKVVGDVVEEIRLVRREEAIMDLVNCLLQLWVCLIVFPGVIAKKGGQ